MSNLYKKYLSLKLEDNSTFYLFESGIFYIFIADDARMMSEILNLKLVNLNSYVFKCGFPKSQLNKYLNILNSLNYTNVKIVNSNSLLAYSQKDYFSNNKSRDFIKKIANLQPQNLSINQSFDLIETLTNEAKDIIHEVEEA